MSLDPEESLDIEQDSHGRAVVVLTCPRCQHEMRRRMRDLPADAVIACEQCDDVEWTFRGDDLAALGRSLDDLGG